VFIIFVKLDDKADGRSFDKDNETDSKEFTFKYEEESGTDLKP
jgi:hypothetical protein